MALDVRARARGSRDGTRALFAKGALAVELAVDAGDYELAASVLDVLSLTTANVKL